MAAALRPLCFKTPAAQGQRDLPKPPALHSGHVFVTGEEVIVPIPKSGAGWSLVVFALHRTNRLSDLQENEAWPYFEIYNFGSQPVRGQLSLDTSPGWEATLPTEIELAPLDRKERSLVGKRAGAISETDGRVRLRGDFSSAGKAV